MICPKCKTTYPSGHKFCPTCEDENGEPFRLVDEQQTTGGFNINLGDANAISGGVNLSDSHNDNSRHFDQRGQTNYNAQGGITITNQAAQTTEQDVVLKKEDRYRAACRRVYEDFVIDDVEIKELKGLAQDLGLSDDRALSILNGVKQQMDAERAREEALNPRAQKRLQRLLNSMRDNDVEAVVTQLESFDEMVTEKNISELHFVYYLAQAALTPKKCIALAEKSMTDSYWRSYWSYVAYMKSGNKKDATRILDSIESKFSDYSYDNTALLAAVGELMQGDKKSADSEFFDVDESNLSPRLQRLFETLLLILDPAEAKENNLRENDYLFYLKHIFNYETVEEREKREREERKTREAEERRLKAETEANRKREEEERKRAEEQKRKEEETRRRAAETEAKRKAEEEARRKAAEEAQRKREEEERESKEAEAKRKREEEVRRRAEGLKHKSETRIQQRPIENNKEKEHTIGFKVSIKEITNKWETAYALKKQGWNISDPTTLKAPLVLNEFCDIETAINIACTFTPGKLEVSPLNELKEPCEVCYNVIVTEIRNKWNAIGTLKRQGMNIASPLDIPKLPFVIKSFCDFQSAYNLRSKLRENSIICNISIQ